MTLRLNGSTSGFTEIDAPAVAGSNTLVLPTGAGSAYQVVRNGATAGSLEFADKIVSGTAVASTSGTSIDFTGIPSWVKRVTVMLNGVSTSGSSAGLLRVGTSSGVISTGYTSGATVQGATNAVFSANTTTGLLFSPVPGASSVACGFLTLLNVSGNSWVFGFYLGFTDAAYSGTGGGAITLSGTLDRVRITTVNGTDTFDAGSINILYE
jgi:hypothetical protein